jgi:hypothetical protein
MLVFLSWLSGHTHSCPIRCAQGAYLLRKRGPKTVRKLAQPRPLRRLPPYLGEYRLATPQICARGLPTRCESPQARSFDFSPDCRILTQRAMDTGETSHGTAPVPR